jgi:hypothetical protein
LLLFIYCGLLLSSKSFPSQVTRQPNTQRDYSRARGRLSIFLPYHPPRRTAIAATRAVMALHSASYHILILYHIPDKSAIRETLILHFEKPYFCSGTLVHDDALAGETDSLPHEYGQKWQLSSGCATGEFMALEVAIGIMICFMSRPTLQATWLGLQPIQWAHLDSNQEPTGYEPVALPIELWARWSGRRDLNSRQPAWKAGALPLSYSRMSRGGRTRTADLLDPSQAR